VNKCVQYLVSLYYRALSQMCPNIKSSIKTWVVYTLTYSGGKLPLLIKGRFYMNVCFVNKGNILHQCFLCALHGKILRQIL